MVEILEKKKMNPVTLSNCNFYKKIRISTYGIKLVGKPIVLYAPISMHSNHKDFNMKWNRNINEKIGMIFTGNYFFFNWLIFINAERSHLEKSQSPYQFRSKFVFIA